MTAEMRAENPLPVATPEIQKETLEAILQPDEVLAAQALDQAIQKAEASENPDLEALQLLHFQRSMVDMTERDAVFAARRFGRETGKYITFNGIAPPSPHYPLIRGMVIPDLADQERWRILGVDPWQYGDSPLANSYRKGIERDWHEAIRARQALAEAQIAEAEAMERVTHPPVFEP